MNRIWSVFFVGTAVVAVVASLAAPSFDWWFPYDGLAYSTLGRKIDDLFYLILYIVTATFIGTHIALGYVLWTGADQNPNRKVWFSHGSHMLEVIWTIVPSAILLFIALYQMDVWAKYRMQEHADTKMEPVAEVTARQFEWRIRYPARGKKLMPDPQPDDLYSVNDLHVPIGHTVAITLRSEDVQHSFFVPMLRVKQDAVPGLRIPVWFEITKAGRYELTCAELCGWGHYKMKAQVVASSETEFDRWKQKVMEEQFDDGVSKKGSVETADR